MEGEEAVGCRVQVYWEEEEEWFEGVVATYSPDRGYYVKYDDGEEQWELDVGECPIRFLSESESRRSDVMAVAAASSKETEDPHEASNSNCSDDEETGEYEEDHEDEEPREKREEAVNLVSGSEDQAMAQCALPTMQLQQKTRKPAQAFMQHSAIFFRDMDTLRKMRQELCQEKKMLKNQVQVLAMQLNEKEQMSAALKTELQQLKTSEALAAVMRQAPRSTCSRKTSTEGSLKPKTTVRWSERILDLKLENQCLAKDKLALETAIQDKRLAVQRKQRRRDEIGAKLARFSNSLDLHTEQILR